MQNHLDLLSNEELMELYCQGNQTAFNTLYTRFSNNVYGYLISRCGSATIASELTQDIFLKFHRSRHLYLKKFPVIAWLFTITKNVFLDYCRKKKSENRTLSEFILESDPLHIDTMSQTEVQNFLEKLPENQKAAIMYRYTQDWTFEEIANQLKVSPENARQLTARGLKKIRLLFFKKGYAHEK